MDTSKHTPTPWEQDGLRINSENGSTTSIAVCDGVTIGVRWSGSDYATAENAEANVAFIVRACNAHDQLVAALKAILATRPQYGMNPQAIVGDPHGIGWNVHGIAREALEAAGAA